MRRRSDASRLDELEPAFVRANTTVMTLVEENDALKKKIAEISKPVIKKLNCENCDEGCPQFRNRMDQLKRFIVREIIDRDWAAPGADYNWRWGDD